MNQTLSARSLAAIAALGAAAACGSSPGGGATTEPPDGMLTTAASSPAVLTHDCMATLPLPVDEETDTQAPRPTWLLVLTTPLSSTASLLLPAENALVAASAAGATVIVVNGNDASTSAPIPLAGLGGNNPSARQQERCAHLADADRQARVATSAPTQSADLFGALKAGFDTFASQPASAQTTPPATSPDTVVMLGAATSTATVRLTGEALDDPNAVLQVLGGHGLLRKFTGWRFAYAGPDASDSTATGVGERAFWLAYAQACGGRLVGWSPEFTSPGLSALPAPSLPAPSPTPSRTATRGVETYVVPSSALFALNSAELTSHARLALVKAVAAARHGKRVTVDGFTDNTVAPGDPGFNQRLSAARARAVVRLMRKAGVTVPITARGYGARHPIAPNTPGSRYLNRRVEVHVYVK